MKKKDSRNRVEKTGLILSMFAALVILSPQIPAEESGSHMETEMMTESGIVQESTGISGMAADISRKENTDKNETEITEEDITEVTEQKETEITEESIAEETEQMETSETEMSDGKVRIPIRFADDIVSDVKSIRATLQKKDGTTGEVLELTPSELENLDPEKDAVYDLEIDMNTGKTEIKNADLYTWLSYGIVFTGESSVWPTHYLNARTLPTTDAEVIKVLVFGQEYKIVGKATVQDGYNDGEWLLVILEDGSPAFIAGWIVTEDESEAKAAVESEAQRQAEEAAAQAAWAAQQAAAQQQSQGKKKSSGGSKKSSGDKVEYFDNCDGSGGTKVITHPDGSQEFVDY